MQKWQQLWHSGRVQQQKASKKSGLVGASPADYAGKKLTSTGSGRCWWWWWWGGWFKNPGQFFVSTLWGGFFLGTGLRMGWKVAGLLSTEVLCLRRAVHPGPWQVCRDSRLGPEQLALIDKMKVWSWRTGKTEQNGYSHQWTATLWRSDPFQPKDFCLVILNLRPQIVLNFGLSWFPGFCLSVGLVSQTVNPALGCPSAFSYLVKSPNQV